MPKIAKKDLNKRGGFNFKRSGEEVFAPFLRKAGMAKKMSHHKMMEKKGKRYVAAPAPSPDEDRQAYYKKHKGRYVTNIIGKDGKYI